MPDLRLRSVVASITLCSILSCVPVIAFAAPAPAGLQINTEESVPVRGDFQIGPTRFSLTLAPGEETTVTLQVLNRGGVPSAYRLSTEDFSAAGDPLDPTRLYGNEDGPYSARAWITPAVTTMVLSHGQRAFVTVRVRVPTDAEPGDHYAALFVERQPEEGGSAFNVVSRVGALLMIGVKGRVIRDGSLTSLHPYHAISWTTPVSLQLEAQNRGTIHMIPEGTVIIRNVLGFPVDELPVERWVVLRDSDRAVMLTWRPAFAIGRYTATTNLHIFGEATEPLKTSFWVIPALPILVLLCLIFMISFVLQFFLTRFEVKRRRR